MWSGRFSMITYFFFWALLLVTCGYALWRGRTYERLSALICIAATVLSVLFHSSFQHRYFGIEVGDLVIDTFVLLAFVAIALRSDRFWPLWVAGLQLTMGMSHLFKALVPSLLPFAYAAAERFWSYPTLIIIFIGAWRQHQRHANEQDEAGLPA